MMSQEPEGATPLDPDDLEGLIPVGILTRADLNAREQAGVLDGRRWALGRRRSTSRVLTEHFLRELHRRMFGNVWRWAGTFRTTDKNIGTHWPQLRVAMLDAIADAAAWVAAGTWTPKELAARFHHRLVRIHPFPNGNGRWSRLATDALMRSVRHPLPTWGAALDAPTTRAQYLNALRAADNGKFEQLVAFIWS
jgi:Fic-DOC domain mobile mystery protein B